jgi:hypothetical protein
VVGFKPSGPFRFVPLRKLRPIERFRHDVLFFRWTAISPQSSASTRIS